MLSAILILLGTVSALVLLGVVVYFAAIVPLSPWLNKRDKEAEALAQARRTRAEEQKEEFYRLRRNQVLSQKR